MNDENNAQVETGAPAQAAVEAPAQNTSYDTLLGGQADNKDANNNTDAQTVEQPVEQTVAYNFADTIKGYEGFEFSQEDSNNFVSTIKDMGLNNDQANAIVKYGMDWASNLVKGTQENLQAELDEMVKGWGETAKQELGTNFEATLSKAGSTLELVEKSIPGIRQALQETGAGNRVEIIKALAFFADKFAGDPGMISGVQGSNPANAAANLYPNTDFNLYK